MIPEDDARHTIEFKNYYVIQPDFVWWDKKNRLLEKSGKACPDGFSYKSDTNKDWLSARGDMQLRLIRVKKGRISLREIFNAH